MPAAGGVNDVSLTDTVILAAPLFSANLRVSVPSVNKSAAKTIVTVLDVPTTNCPSNGMFISFALTPVIV